MTKPWTDEFLQLLSALMQTGKPAEQALQQLKGHPNKSLSENAQKVLASFEKLGDFDAVAQHHPDIFPEDFRLLLSEVGSAPATASIMEQYVTNQQSIRSYFGLLKNASALEGLYLFAVVIVALILALIYGVFVLPQFQDLYSSIDATLPPFSASVLGISKIIGQFWWLLLLAIAFAIWVILKQRKWYSDISTDQPPTWLVRAPILGDRLRLLYSAKAVGILKILLDQKLELTRALSVSRAYASNHKALLDDLLSRGLGSDWHAKMVFYQTNGLMQAKSEQIGTLLFDCIAADLLSNNRVKMLIFMVLIASFVGALVIAIYLPIFQLGNIVVGAS